MDDDKIYHPLIRREKEPIRKKVEEKKVKKVQPEEPFSRLRYLHENLGNKKIGELLEAGIIQPKLLLNQVSDKYEIEADLVGKELRHSIETHEKKQGIVKKKSDNKSWEVPLLERVNNMIKENNKSQEKAPKEKKKKSPLRISRLFKRPGKNNEVSKQLETNIKQATSSGGKPIDEKGQKYLKNHFIEQNVNIDIGKVRIYSGRRPTDVAAPLNALAFTYGGKIVIGRNAPKPGTPGYYELLAHEVTHTVQQGALKANVIQRSPDDKRKENKKKAKDEKEKKKGGLFSGIAGFLFEKALKLVGIDPASFGKMLGTAIGVIGDIIKNPGKFLGNLITALKLGIGNFVGNIVGHMKKGLASWLFGNLAAEGLQLPQSFDVKGIFGLVAQIFGLTYNSIRTRIAKGLGKMGESIMGKLEAGLDFIKNIVTNGPMALWEHMKDSLSGLPGKILGGVIGFVRNNIIVKGIAKILSMLNPAGAIIGIINTVWKIGSFFISCSVQFLGFSIFFI